MLDYIISSNDFSAKHAETMRGVSLEADLNPLTVEEWIGDPSVDYVDILQEVFRGVDAEDDSFFDDLAESMPPQALMSILQCAAVAA